MFGVRLPVCCQMQMTARGESRDREAYEVRLNQTPLMMPFFMPRVGKKDLHEINRVDRYDILQHLHRIIRKYL